MKDENKRFGFDPTLYCQVAGVVAGGQDRQDILRRASVFVSKVHTLTYWNSGLYLEPEPTNQYDENAIKVWVATALRQNEFTEPLHVGYIPKRVCTKCFHSWGGKKADRPACPECDESMNHTQLTFLNWYINTHFYKRGVGIYVAVDWIAQGKQPGSSWGCRLALAFPDIGHV